MGERGVALVRRETNRPTLPALPIPRERVLDTNLAPATVFHALCLFLPLQSAKAGATTFFDFARAASPYKEKKSA